MSFFELTVDKSSYDSNENDYYNDIHNFTIFHDEFPIFFEIFPDDSEKGISESRTDSRIDDEFGQIHFSHSRRQRNKMSDDGYKSADKNSDASFPFEEMFCRIQLFLIKKKIFSESSDEWFASIISYRIGQQRSDDTRYRTHDNHSWKAEMFRCYQKACERHNGFTRHRKDHTFHHHSDEDSNISCRLDKLSDIGCEEFGDSHIQLLNC